MGSRMQEQLLFLKLGGVGNVSSRVQLKKNWGHPRVVGLGPYPITEPPP